MRLVLILLPWLELFTLIQLGIRTSALAAVAWVFFTVMLGLVLLQRQGRELVEQLRQGQLGGPVVSRLLLDDMAMGLAGLLLMVPGLITDAAALVVAIGPLRRRLVTVFTGPTPSRYQPSRDNQGGHTIEGSFRRLDDDENS